MNILSVQSGSISYEEFEAAMLSEGVISLDRGNGHWQVKTQLCTINYYPWSARKTIFVPAIPNITEALRFERAEVATVVKLVQDLKAKEKKYASNNNVKKRSDTVRSDG